MCSLYTVNLSHLASMLEHDYDSSLDKHWSVFVGGVGLYVCGKASQRHGEGGGPKEE